MATTAQSRQKSTPIPVNSPKLHTGRIGEVRKERKPMAVVSEVSTIGRPSSARLWRSASIGGWPAGRWR